MKFRFLHDFGCFDENGVCRRSVGLLTLVAFTTFNLLFDRIIYFESVNQNYKENQEKLDVENGAEIK